jgi:biotin carboxylase
VKALGAKIILAKTNSRVMARQVKKRIHGTRARAGQIFGDSKGTGAKVLGIHPEIHTKSRKFRSR